METLFASMLFTNEQGMSLPYRLYTPERQEETDTLPLVLFLHGAGERGDDNEAQLRHGIRDFAARPGLLRFPCHIVAPQCPSGEKWADVEWGDERHEMSDQPTPALSAALALTVMLRDTLAVDRERIYITGISMGGYGTWEAICRRPTFFAAAVPVCGGGDERCGPRLTKIPVWAFHGALDQTVKVVRSRNMVAAITEAGGSPRYTEYPDVSHDSWNHAYRTPGFHEWLFAQRRSPENS